MPNVTKSLLKVKQENQIQNYINTFKEMEEQDVQATLAGSSSASANEKIFITPDQNYEQMETVDDGGGNDEEYKYVFIVQDDEDGTEDKMVGEGEEEEDEENQIYEFEDYEEEEALEETDDKSKIIKVETVAKKVGTGGNQVNSGVTHMCTYCNYSTGKRYLLARHMKCHSEDRPHKCNVCERGFKTIASLTNHVNTHTGIKVRILSHAKVFK